MQPATIYYSDGTYEGAPEGAMARDVQAIVQHHPKTGWQIEYTKDYYVWQGERVGWSGVDIFGLWDYLDQPGWKKVLFGRLINNEEYNEIITRAHADRKERKAGRTPRERIAVEA